MNPLRNLMIAISRIPPAIQLLTIIGIAVAVTLLVNGQLISKQKEYDDKMAEVQNKLNGVDGKVVMIAKDIQEGSVISSSSLEEKSLNMNKVPPDAITSTSMAAGRVAKYSLMAGQILSQHDLAPLGISLGFESRLPKGMRAITFAIDTNSGVAGFVSPDSHVDVMSMVGSGAETQVAPILSDVPVIAVGQVYEKTTEKSAAMPANSVTVAVSPEDAQKLVKAIAASKLYLSLRNKDDHIPVATVDVTALFPKGNGEGGNDNNIASSENGLGNIPLPPPPVAGELDNPSFPQLPGLGTAEPPPPPNHQIEMWSGERKSLIELPGSGQ